jgi:signal peptidase I
MKIFKEILDWVLHIAGGIVVALLIVIFIGQPTHVDGSSMEPTYKHADQILVNKLPHTFGSGFDYSDVVIIDSRVDRPRTLKDDIFETIKYNLVTYKLFKIEQDHYWVKRVIGMPGDVLEYKDGKLYRNFEILEEPYIKEQMEFFPGKLTVPEDCLFVMGDNRNYSCDSRNIGFVPIDHVIAKVAVKF